MIAEFAQSTKTISLALSALLFFIAVLILGPLRHIVWTILLTTAVLVIAFFLFRHTLTFQQQNAISLLDGSASPIQTTLMGNYFLSMLLLVLAVVMVWKA